MAEKSASVAAATEVSPKRTASSNLDELAKSSFSSSSSNSNHQRRKRKRLNAVLDKILQNQSSRTSNSEATAAPVAVPAASSATNGSRSRNGSNNNNNHIHHPYTNSDDEANDNKVVLNVASPNNMFGRSDHTARAGSGNSAAALKREKWRDNQQQSVEEHVVGGIRTLLQASSSKNSSSGGSTEVFKFDSFDRDRYYSGGSRDEGPAGVGAGAGALAPSLAPLAAHHQIDDHNLDPETFSPVSGRSPHSSLSSPQVCVYANYE